MRAALRFARAVRLWFMRLAASVLMHTGFMPLPMQRVWLEWLRSDMGPAHPDLPTVLLELADTEDRCRA